VVEPPPAAQAPIDSGGTFLARSDEVVTPVPGSSPGTFETVLTLPRSDAFQVPLSYEIRTEPAEGLRAASIEEVRPGTFVAHLRLARPALGDSIRFYWSSLVSVRPRSFADVPGRVPLPPKWPDEAVAWTRASRCVESDDLEIRAIAARLKSGSDDVLELIRRTTKEVQDITRRQTGQARVFDARGALRERG
jgi:hypothetical protein